MKNTGASAPQPTSPILVLLADDDSDDRFFFKRSLDAAPLTTLLTTVKDGEELMNYLLQQTEKLPHILFLDLNMPRKSGAECLVEIKSNAKLKVLPVVIYSTASHENVADLLYANGAHYYVRKTDTTQLKKILHHFLTLLMEDKFTRPQREHFILALA
jgi:CheY-like chemotaxis protein